MPSREEMKVHTDVENYLEVAREAVDRLYFAAIAREDYNSLKYIQAVIDFEVSLRYLDNYQKILESKELIRYQNEE